MIDHVLTHWKTTLAGAIAAGCAVALPMVVSGSSDDRAVIVAFVLAAVGAAAKDPA